MVKNKEETTLDDALNTFVAENDRPTAENLKVWVELYPQYRRELVDFAIVWAEQLVLPPASVMGPEAEKVQIDRAMSHVLNVAYNQKQQRQEHVGSEDPITSLTSERQRVDISVQELARACGLDLALVSKLNNRQINPETIPLELFNRLGKILRKSPTAIRAYLEMPTQNAMNISFLARGKPIGAVQQSFADAVRASSLSEKEKARWLYEGMGKED